MQNRDIFIILSQKVSYPAPFPFVLLLTCLSQEAPIYVSIVYLCSTCDNLRCIGCDFSVLQFRGKKWHDEADYMFFRNNMPNPQKLAVMLLDDAGGWSGLMQM